MTSFQPDAPSLPTDRNSNIFCKLPFPWKLQQLLEDAENDGNQHIISWETDTIFKVHSPEQFRLRIMKLYFRQTQYRSFTRQLYVYGFSRISIGQHRGGFTHPDFVRGNKTSVLSIVRRKNGNPHAEPPSQQIPNSVLGSEIMAFSEARAKSRCPSRNKLYPLKSTMGLEEATDDSSNKPRPREYTAPRENIDHLATPQSHAGLDASRINPAPHFSGDKRTANWMELLLSKMTDNLHEHDDLEPRPIEVMIKNKSNP